MRKLGCFETLMCLLNVQESSNFVIYFTIDKLVDEKLFQAACEKLQQLHEILNLSIALDKGCFVRCTLPFQYQVVKAKQSQCSEIIQRRLLTKFNLPYEPLLKPILIYDLIMQTTTVVFVFHHSCADGISASQLVIDFLDILDSNESHDVDKEFQLLKPALESLFTKYDPCQSVPAHFVIPNHEGVSMPQTVSTIKLNYEQLQKLCRFCRSEQLSFHPVLSVILATELLKQVMGDRIVIQSPVDMRRYSKRVDHKDLLYCSSRIDYVFTDSNYTLIDLAKQMADYFNKYLRQQSISNILVMQDYVRYLLDRRDLVIKPAWQSKLPIIFFSNLGQVELPHQFKGFQISDMGLMLNSNAFLPNQQSILVTTVSIEQQCVINIHFPKNSQINGKILSAGVLKTIEALFK